jgi:dihydrodipicolinate synthase/N-acetylneuraminate lyase
MGPIGAAGGRESDVAARSVWGRAELHGGEDTVGSTPLLVSLVTPHDAQGRVDLPRLRAHVLWLAAQGVDGFVATLTAGELPYLSDREKEAIHRTVLDAAGERAVYCCTWDPSPATTTWLSRSALEAGAAGVILPPPLYAELDDPAIEDWFTTMAADTAGVVAYHHPAYVRAIVSAALLDRLHAQGILSGILDASEDVWRLQRVARTKPGFVLAGADRALASLRDLPLRAVVSDLANAWPSLCLRAWREGDADLGEAMLDRVSRVRRAGGARAMKSLLRMGSRRPLIEPEDAALEGLPPAEGP